MRHNIALSVLVLALTAVVLGESGNQESSVHNLVEKVIQDFNKDCARANKDYKKQITPVIKRYNLKRTAKIHSSGKAALRKLRKIATDAKKNESPVGEALAKDGMTYIDKTMGESEVPLMVGEVWRARFGGHHYLAVLAPVSWKQAGKICKKMGGHLVYIETDKEMEFVRKLTANTAVYVGATDEHKEGDWRWLNGRKVRKSFWAPRRPAKSTRLNEAALYSEGMTNPGSWNPKGRNFSRGFVCEWDN